MQLLVTFLAVGAPGPPSGHPWMQKIQNTPTSTKSLKDPPEPYILMMILVVN